MAAVYLGRPWRRETFLTSTDTWKLHTCLHAFLCLSSSTLTQIRKKRISLLDGLKTAILPEWKKLNEIQGNRFSPCVISHATDVQLWKISRWFFDRSDRRQCSRYYRSLATVVRNTWRENIETWSRGTRNFYLIALSRGIGVSRTMIIHETDAEVSRKLNRSILLFI